jgi:DNA-binding GntR family transcriptional regulator
MKMQGKGIWYNHWASWIDRQMQSDDNRREVELRNDKRSSIVASGPRYRRPATNGKVAQPLKGPSLSDVAYGKLIDMLRSGELRPNDLIMETHLSRQVNVSRTPLREAIRRLEGEKILERQRSGTLVVRAMSIEDLLHVWQIRHLLEGDAARRAAGQISVRDLRSLRARTVTIKNSSNPKPEDLWSIGRQLHDLIGNASGNPLLASVIEDFRKRTQLLMIRRVPERLIKVCEEHLAIIDALIAGNGEEAKTAMQRHIEGVRAYTLEKLGAL